MLWKLSTPQILLSLHDGCFYWFSVWQVLLLGGCFIDLMFHEYYRVDLLGWYLWYDIWALDVCFYDSVLFLILFSESVLLLIILKVTGCSDCKEHCIQKQTKVNRHTSGCVDVGVMLQVQVRSELDPVLPLRLNASLSQQPKTLRSKKHFPL